MDGLGRGGRDAALALQAQGLQGEPERGAGGARPWDRDWGTVPDPLGDEALPLVVEVYGWLRWASSGTSRGMRNRPFDAVLLWRHGGNQEVPPGGQSAPKDHERVLRSVIRAAWPDREPTWLAILEGKAVLRITDADANNWLPRALRNALTHWRYRRRNRHRHSPSPHTTRGTGDGPEDGRERVGGGTVPWYAPPGGAGPPDPRTPHNTARRRGARHLPWEGGQRQRARGGGHCPAAH